MRSLLTRVDPITYAGVVALLLAVSAVPCWFPAWRAVRVDHGMDGRLTRRWAAHEPPLQPWLSRMYVPTRCRSASSRIT